MTCEVELRGLAIPEDGKEGYDDILVISCCTCFSTVSLLHILTPVNGYVVCFRRVKWYQEEQYKGKHNSPHLALFLSLTWVVCDYQSSNLNYLISTISISRSRVLFCGPYYGYKFIHAFTITHFVSFSTLSQTLTPKIFSPPQYIRGHQLTH